jgi:hypothetical protein
LYFEHGPSFVLAAYLAQHFHLAQLCVVKVALALQIFNG